MELRPEAEVSRRFVKRSLYSAFLVNVTSVILMNLMSRQHLATGANSIGKPISSASLLREEPATTNLAEEKPLPGPAAAAASQIEQTNALHYLQRYGYLGGSGSQLEATNNLISEDSFTGAVKSFQRFAGIPETGTTDELTQRFMQMPRCGNTDKSNDSSSVNGVSQLSNSPAGALKISISNSLSRRKRYALQGSKWRRQELTYRISQYPTRFSGKRHEVDAQIEKAFGIWSQVAPINFVVKREGRVHIDIRFASGDHGDGDAFDGPGNTLAHAYFPQYGGDAHFDDQEYWTIDSYAGTNIFQVAAHELGHSLGLGHSNVREALMAPFYQKYKPHFKLHIDDVLAIQALYGEKPLFLQPGEVPPATRTTVGAPTTSLSTPAPTTTSSSTTSAPESTFESRFGSRDGPASRGHKPDVLEGAGPPEAPDVSTNGLDGNSESASPRAPGAPADLCSDSMIDAVTRTEDGSSYVFKGDHYWLLTSEGLARGYPRRIAADWEGLPGSLDAALTWADGKTFFFKGNKYWRFRNKRRDLGYPKLISSGFAGIPNDIDAAFVWSGNGRTYIFKGAEYWRFDSKAEPPVSAEYPRSVKVWNGVPAHINAAFKWENNVTYFFKGQQYYRFNDQEFKIEARGRPPFPRNSAEWWFGCGSPSSSLSARRPAGFLRPSSLVATAAATAGAEEEDFIHQAGSFGEGNNQLETAGQQAPSTSDWSFFSGFDAEQQGKIPGTHISDHETVAGGPEGPEVSYTRRIGLSGRRHAASSSSAIKISRLISLLGPLSTLLALLLLHSNPMVGLA